MRQAYPIAIAAALVTLLATGCPFAVQPWVKTFEIPGFYSNGKNAVPQKGGGFVLVGNAEPVGGGPTQILALRINAHGAERWQSLQDFDGAIHALSALSGNRGGTTIAVQTHVEGGGKTGILQLDKFGNSDGTTFFDFIEESDGLISGEPTADGGFLMGGVTDGVFETSAVGLILKFDRNGNLERTDSYADFDSNLVIDIVPMDDGNFMALHGMLALNETIFVQPALSKLDRDGRLIWYREIDVDLANFPLLPQKLLRAKNGGFIIAGLTIVPRCDPTDLSRLVFIRTDDRGTQIGRNFIQLSQFCGLVVKFGSATEAPGGGFVVGFTIDTSERSNDLALLRVEDNLEPRWLKTYGSSVNPDWLSDVTRAPGGGYLLLGRTRKVESVPGNIMMAVRTDADGNAPNVTSSTTDIDSTGF